MIIFLYGADTFRSQRLLKELKDKFQRDVDPGAASLGVVDGQTATLSAVAEKIGAGSLFVKKRLVVIEDIFKNKKENIFSELLEYLKKLPAEKEAGDNIIIFRDEELDSREKPLKAAAKKLFAFLLKQQYVQEFKTLSGSQLLSFVKKEAKSYDKDIAAAAATDLVNRTGGDLWLLAGSIKKLAFRCAETTINADAVAEMVAGAYDENIFGLTDALSARNKSLALRLLEEQYAAGLSNEYLLTMLIRQFKILLQIRAALDTSANPAALPVQLKLHPFVVKKGIAQARNFTLDILKNHLNDLVRLDWQNKTGRGDLKTELTLLISRL